MNTGSQPQRLVKVSNNNNNIVGMCLCLCVNCVPDETLLGCAAVLEAVVGIVSVPEPDHPLRADVAKLFVEKRADFDKV